MLNVSDLPPPPPPSAEVRTWNLAALYPTPSDWDREAGALEALHEKGWPPLPKSLEGAEDPERVVASICAYFDYQRRLQKLYTYARRWSDEDLRVNEAREAVDRVRRLYQQYDEATCWLAPELIRLPSNTWERLCEAACAQPFKQWTRILQRQRAHVLGEEGEQLMAMVSDALGGTKRAFTSLDNVDLRFDPALDEQGNEREVTHALAGVYARGSDRQLRESSWHSIRRAYHNCQHTLAELRKGHLDATLFVSRARRYNSTLEASLDPQGIPTDLYRQVIAAVHRKLHVLHRYMELKRRWLGVETLQPWDVYAPLVADEVGEIPYETAIEWVVGSVAPLGAEYQERVRAGLNEKRWVHPFEQPGKRSGGYMGGGYDGPPYILMNYRGDLNSVFTLAHEVGHAMHNELANASNPFWDAGYSIFIAEIASTFNEELLHDYLETHLRHPQARAHLLQERIEGVYSTILRQVLYAEWELWTHESTQAGEPLTADRMSEQWAGLCAQYHGPHLHIPPLTGIEWARIPHFYSPFYVYQYATGLSSALWLHEEVVKGSKADARGRYLDFLRAGGSRDPLELLEAAGVRLRNGEAIELALDCMERWVTELEQVL